MINAQLKLIIPVFTPQTNSYKLLSSINYGIQFPSIEIEPDSDLHELIRVVLNRYFKDPSTIIPKLIDIEVDANLSIYYLCFVNYETDIINGELKNIDVNTDKFPSNAAKTLSLLFR